MFLRIEIEKISLKNLLKDIPCLSSKNAVSFELSGIENVVFWYLDVDVLNRDYRNALEALQVLLQYEGVNAVHILPLQMDIDGLSEERYADLLSCLEGYVNGPVK